MQQRRTPKVTPGDDTARDVVREYGDSWDNMAAQAMVWSYLLREIPAQLLAHNRQVKEARRARLNELERYFPADPEIAKLEKEVADAILVPSITMPNGPVPSPVASIVRRLCEFPRHEAHVDFALSREGELSIRCVGVSGPRLPAFIRSPERIDDAHPRAVSLVRAAILTLTAND